MGPWFVAVFSVALPALWPELAHAQAQNLGSLGPAPIVRVNVGSGNVNVRTWDRDSVEVDDPSNVTIRRFTVQSTAAQSTIPILAGKVAGPTGPVELPEESFAVSTLAPGSHDVVAVRGQDANVTVTVPQTSALVTVQMGQGNVSLTDYRRGTFVTRVRNGSVHLQNVGGDGYVQVMRGPISADGSTFNRLRMRSGTGDVILGNCRSKQIEVTSVRGSIVYDGGSFEPGLARFETQSGNVALGVNGGAQLAAHAAGGHVLTAFDSSAKIKGRNGEQQAVLGGGGPLVNATSGTGSVYLYGGQFASHRLPSDWQPIRSMLAGVGRPVGAESAPTRTVTTTHERPRVLTPTPDARPLGPRAAKRRMIQPQERPEQARPQERPEQARPPVRIPERKAPMPIRPRRDARAPVMNPQSQEAPGPGRRGRGRTRATPG